MAWYKKYISVYGKAINAIDHDTIAVIKEKIGKLQSPNPLATVSIIAYNEEKQLTSCLWSLSENKCKYPIEIIGVNNDSTDLTAEVYRLTNIPYFTEYKHSCGYARLCGLNHAKGKYHINIDADTMYPPHYIETMIENLMQPGVIGVSSTWGYIPDDKHSSFSLKLYETIRDIYLTLLAFKRPELSVRGMVFAYHTDWAKKVGIRVHIKRGEDGALAFDLKQYGKLKFIRSKRVKAITGYGTLGADGSLFNSFKIRAIKAFKSIPKFFTRAKEYKDRKDNLVS